MSRDRYISIPLNEDGKTEYDAGIENTDNILVLNLPEKEFDFLYSKGIFNDINNKCDLLIDDYESEVINNKSLQWCKDIMSQYDDIGTLKKAIDLAIKNNTFVGLDF